MWEKEFSARLAAETNRIATEKEELRAEKERMCAERAQINQAIIAEKSRIEAVVVAEKTEKQRIDAAILAEKDRFNTAFVAARELLDFERLQLQNEHHQQLQIEPPSPDQVAHTQLHQSNSTPKPSIPPASYK
ncbi:hypothetical protein DFH28DRAFT_901453 [Melampsora americana]|nr:hypothetical protein DFH28DRAFT_901453 [Melampsora americana]